MAAGALAAVLLALVGDRIPGPAAAVLGLTLGLLRLPVAAAAVVPLACHPELGHGAGLGPLAALDILVVCLCVRLAMRWLREPVRSALPLQALLAVALLAGVVATGVAGEGVTPFLRLSAYLVLAALLVAVVRPQEARAVVRCFVGVAAGQAAAALAGLTPTAATGLPLGRYLGTYGDPFQFGVAMAAGLLIVVASPVLAGVGSRARWPLAALMAAGLAGSNTRGAWGATLVACTAIAAVTLGGARSRPAVRFLLGFGLGASLVGLVAAVTLAAPVLGLNPVSTRVRVDSIADTWRFFVQHPLSPQGLGNYPAQLPAYNTLLALSVGLTPVFALALAGFAVAAVRSASDLAERGLFGALVAFCAVTLTENLIYAGSAATISWLLLSALAIPLARHPQGELDWSADPRPAET